MEYFKYPLPKLGKEKRPYKIFKINISWKKKKKKKLKKKKKKKKLS